MKQNRLLREMHSAVKKKQPKKLLLLLLLLLVIVIASRYAEPFFDQKADINDQMNTADAMIVHFIDVGQGDAIYITMPTGESMLIDAGPNASETQLLAYLSKYNADTFDYAVFTHPHEDHIGGADKVLAAYGAQNVILPDADSTTTTYERMVDAIVDCGADVIIADAGNTYSLGEASFQILGPVNTSYDNLNNASVVIHFIYRDISLIFTGDAEKASEQEILDAFGTEPLRADVLKAGHHGSGTSTSKAFLDAVNPSVAVISCGENNDYGHPHTETLTAFGQRDIRVLRTDESGSVRIYSDGSALLIQSDR